LAFCGGDLYHSVPSEGEDAVARRWDDDGPTGELTVGRKHQELISTPPAREFRSIGARHLDPHGGMKVASKSWTRDFLWRLMVQLDAYGILRGQNPERTLARDPGAPVVVAIDRGEIYSRMLLGPAPDLFVQLTPMGFLRMKQIA